MIEFDENLNPIDGGKPTGDDMPPIYQGPTQEQPIQEPPRQTPPPQTPPPTPPRPTWQTPPPPPREPRGAGLGIGLVWIVVIGLLIVVGLAVTNIDFGSSS